ncbi:MATE efflux family [Chlorella sorokiniana]|uniref:Protein DETOXIFICATION n=1 Tax=Chlorella sorokiniana TaxID=3076 RepID=A0A2P6U3J3_CHLSO|nr:MATE efflux family [Chlorella sorokiniana]|eukprot:PRW60882.1 MATE efflux family [Chlorella sorokiniana]
MTAGSSGKLSDEEQPLLEEHVVECEDSAALTPHPTLLQEVVKQGRISAPLSIGLVANYLLSVISLSFVGHLGTAELAAAALATTLYSMSAKIMLAGMLGALDTYSSQAVGARNYGALGSMFKQAVFFLLLHTLPIAITFASLPALLKRLGQAEEVTRLLGPYLLALLPAVWVDAFYRPFNRILVAQHVTMPQMWISCLVALQHVGATYVFIHPFKMGYVGAAWATTWSSLLATLLVAAYVRASNLHLRVWATPNGVRFQPWRPYIKLSYSACAMRAIESWSLSLCSVAAGWLPNPEASLAAMAVAFSLYGMAQMVFASLGMSACTRVGNGLGAGSAPLAKLSALAAVTTMPPLWVSLAVVLVVPKLQYIVISVFTSDTGDSVLMGHCRHLLLILAVLLLFDMAQNVLSGIAIGAGKQTRGFTINAVAHWGFGLPTALLLGFYFKLGVEGLYAGVVLGPLVQWICYTWLVSRMDWEAEAVKAHRHMLEVAESMSGAGI